MKRIRKPQPDRRPWAVVDTAGEYEPVHTWHRANAQHLARELLPGSKTPGRYKIVDRTKAPK